MPWYRSAVSRGLYSVLSEPALADLDFSLLLDEPGRLMTGERKGGRGGRGDMTPGRSPSPGNERSFCVSPPVGGGRVYLRARRARDQSGRRRTARNLSQRVCDAASHLYKLL